MKRTGTTGINGTNGTNGHDPQYGAAASAASPDGDEMDTGKGPDITEETLTRIMATKTARIQEDQKDVSAIERVLAILKGEPGAQARDGGDFGDEPHGGDFGDEPHENELHGGEDPGGETINRDLPATNIEQAAEQAAPQAAEKLDEDQPADAAFLTHALEAPRGDLLAMSMEQVREIAADPESAAAFFVQARGGVPVDCPKCGSNEQTRNPHGTRNRIDLFRCNDCRTEFRIKTGTAMHASRPSLGTWMLAARILLDPNRQPEEKITPETLAKLTNAGITGSEQMIAAILAIKDSPGGPAAALVQVRTRPDPTRRGPEETASQEAGEQAPSGTPHDLLSMTITEVSEIAEDPAAAAEYFVKARGGDPTGMPELPVQPKHQEVLRK